MITFDLFQQLAESIWTCVPSLPVAFLASTECQKGTFEYFLLILMI